MCRLRLSRGSKVKAAQRMTSFETTLQAVKAWSSERGIDGASPVSQMLKLTEEVGELAAALARSQITEAADAIGDTMVVLTILCQQLRLELPECFELAYQTIKGRQGKTINGVFVKQNDIKECGE